MPAWGDTLLGSLIESGSKKREAEKERQRTEGQEAQTLRKLMAIYQPDRKDEFTTMALPDLRGEARGFAVKSAVTKQRGEEQKQQQEDQSAAALARVLQDAGSLNETEVLAQGNGPVRQTRQPVAMTPQRLQAVLARNPAAINSEKFAPNLNALRALLGDASPEASGLEFVTSPTGAVIARSRKTDQFQYDPASKADAEANKTRFSVEPILDKFGRPAGYGVKAQFGSESEAKAWADKQNQTSTGTTGEVEAAPLDPKKREKNKVYLTPKGALKWTGTGWMTP